MISIIISFIFSLRKILDVSQSLTAINNMQGASGDIILARCLPTKKYNVCIFWDTFCEIYDEIIELY